MTKRLSNRMIQKRRMYQIFIDATIDIIDNEGIDNVTIRKVADKAGYNSATIYNYFKNLDELKFFSVMSYMQKYLETLSYTHEEFKDPISQYKYVWEVFALQAFQYPTYFKIIFFKQIYEDIEPVLKEYYELFPESIPGDVNIQKEVIEDMLRKGDISSRSMVLMKDIIDAGLINEEEGKLVDSMTIRLFKSLLDEVENKEELKEEYLEKFKKYLDLLIPNK